VQGNGMNLANQNFRANRTNESPRDRAQPSGTQMQRGFKLLEARWKYLKAQESFRRSPLLIASRLISWRARCLLQKPAVIKLSEWDARMFLAAEWRGIEKLLFTFRENYEPEMSCLKTILSPGKVFVDAGANIGIYSVAASKLVAETGRVLAFEPSAQSFPVLKKNIALNRLTNVRAFPVALAQESGTAWLHRGPNPTLNSLGKDPAWKQEGEEIVTETLDRALERAGIERVDVIKMDVQGAEELVIRGASRTITLDRPIVIFEVWPEGALLLGLSPAGAWELLKSAGYEFFEASRDGKVSRIETPPAIGNVIAIHRETQEKPRSWGIPTP
jgi:FkbM family methyltransferase